MRPKTKKKSPKPPEKDLQTPERGMRWEFRSPALCSSTIVVADSWYLARKDAALRLGVSVFSMTWLRLPRIVKKK